MIRKLTVSALLIFCISLTAIAQGHYITYNKQISQLDAQPINMYPVNVNPVSCVFTFQLAGAFTIDGMSVGPEILTQISGFDDYKTNGEPNHFIQVDPQIPGNIQVIDIQTDSTDPTGITSRKTKCSVSDNGGTTWQSFPDVPDGRRSGFPVLDLLNGNAVIANHSINPFYSNVLDAQLYVDVAPEAGSFTEYQYATHAPFGIWPQISVLANGNVAMLSRRNVTISAGQETLYVAIWNGINLGARQNIFVTQNPINGAIGSNMQFGISSSGSNVVIMAYPVNENDVFGNARIYTRVSTDNGVTWGTLANTFTPYVSGTDTVVAAGGATVFHKPGTSTWFLGYIETKLIAGGAGYAGATLRIKKSDGTTTTLTDAATVGAATSFYKPMSFVFNIDNPVFGWSRDRVLLYCIYSVVKPDTGATGYNERDLYFQYSSNEGSVWSTPLRLTNTTNIDETYPSMSMWNKGNSVELYEVNFTYMKDPGVGPTTFGGTAPPSRNQLIFRKIFFPIIDGIRNKYEVVHSFSLDQNYPNPFNPSTVIYYSLPKASLVTLKVYDILGREVATLVNGVEQPGVKSVHFDASNFSSGIYYYSITAGDFKDTKKMVLVK